jgi:hypothetical protein
VITAYRLLRAIAWAGALTTIAGCCRPSTGAAPSPEPSAVPESEDRRAAATREHDAKIAMLEKQLAAAKDEATKRALEKLLAAERARGAGGSKATPGCACSPGDPLCSCP